MGYKNNKTWNNVINNWIRFIDIFNFNRGIVLVYKNISLTKKDYAMYFIGVGMGICITLLILSLIALAKDLT